MQTTVRTTVRIRKDLFDQSKQLALENETSLQEIINTALSLGFGKISNVELTKQSMKHIDQFRQNAAKKDIDLEQLLHASKDDQR
jgi:hypothetical protein